MKYLSKIRTILLFKQLRQFFEMPDYNYSRE